MRPDIPYSNTHRGVPQPSRTLRLELVALLTLVLLTPVNAQETGRSQQQLELDKALETRKAMRSLASFTLDNGNTVMFGTSGDEEDMIYVEFGHSGTDVAFPLGDESSLLDRYLTLTPLATEVVPRLLVERDADGVRKIGRRTVVETTVHVQQDLPLTSFGLADWGCGVNDTKANFSNQFCTDNYSGPDLASFCHSGKWTDHTLQMYRKRVQTVTAYCGDTNSLGFGALIFNNEWIGSEWIVQNINSLPYAGYDWVYTDTYSSSPKWRQVYRTSWETDGASLGGFRALTVFSNSSP